MREHASPNGETCWEFVLLYVDDCLVISHWGYKILRKEIGVYFKLKEEPIADPNIYLGGKVRKHEYQTKDNFKKFWSFS